eukprot:NODE_138_length_16264_cov_1.140860.p3 type:complete len:514 gc:universal NODE_138_length_16264_cov_1.140860:5109-3568(-)
MILTGLENKMNSKKSSLSSLLNSWDTNDSNLDNKTNQENNLDNDLLDLLLKKKNQPLEEIKPKSFPTSEPKQVSVAIKPKVNTSLLDLLDDIQSVKKPNETLFVEEEKNSVSADDLLRIVERDPMEKSPSNANQASTSHQKEASFENNKYEIKQFLEDCFNKLKNDLTVQLEPIFRVENEVGILLRGIQNENEKFDRKFKEFERLSDSLLHSIKSMQSVTLISNEHYNKTALLLKDVASIKSDMNDSVIAIDHASKNFTANADSICEKNNLMLKEAQSVKVSVENLKKTCLDNIQKDKEDLLNEKKSWNDVQQKSLQFLFDQEKKIQICKHAEDQHYADRVTQLEELRRKVDVKADIVNNDAVRAKSDLIALDQLKIEILTLKNDIERQKRDLVFKQSQFMTEKELFDQEKAQLSHLLREITSDKDFVSKERNRLKMLQESLDSKNNEVQSTLHQMECEKLSLLDLKRDLTTSNNFRLARNQNYTESIIRRKIGLQKLEKSQNLIQKKLNILS